MPVGFLVTANNKENTANQFESSFIADTLWDSDGEDRKLDLRGPNWRVMCLGDQGMGSYHLWTENQVAEYAGSFVYVLGWCYSRSSQNGRLQPEACREMLSRLRKGLPPVGEDYCGNFAILAFDAQSKILAVQPDPIGVIGIFFVIRDGQVAISNRALRVANYCESALDGHSVISMMRGTHMPFGRTLFEGVQRLKRAEYLQVDLEAARGNVRRAFNLYGPTLSISYADAVELYSERVQAIVKRLLNEESVRFDLTGGNDTRVLAAGIENLTRGNGLRNYAFRITDPEGTPDVRVARQIAEVCGWPLTRMDRYASRDASPEELQRAASSGDGSFTVNGCWDRIEEERAYAAPGRWRAHVGASAGEVFRGFFYTHEMLNLGRTSEVNYKALLGFRTYASRGVNLALFGPQAPTLEEHDEVLMAPYKAIGEEGGSRVNAYKLDQMYVQRHCYRSALSWLMGFVNGRLPFLSWELGGLGLSLPWKYRANRLLVQRVIGRLSPKLAEIPNEDGEPMKPLSFSTLPAYVAAKIPITLGQAARVARKLRGKYAGFNGSFRLPAPSAGYFKVLENAEFLESMFDRALQREVLAEVRSDQRPRDALVTFYTLCTLELLCRQAPSLKKSIEFA